MISFAYPQILPIGLALLLVMILFHFWANRRRDAAIHRLGTPELIQRLSDSINQRGRAWKNRLWFIALILLILSASRPQWGSEVQVIEQQGIQIMLVLDVSPSMLTEDVKPNRLTRAKLEISDLFDHLAGDEIGLVLFSGASFIQFPLTSDYTTARSFIEAANPKMISKAGTSIGDAIQSAMHGFDEKRSSQKVIILFSDGEDHEARTQKAAQEAAEKDIIIYTIGIGTNQGEPIPQLDDNGSVTGYKKDQQGATIISKLNSEVLQEIASLTGGKFYLTNASGSEIDSLVTEMDKLQKEKTESQFEIIGIERFQIFLVTLIPVLLAIEIIPERKQKKKLPAIGSNLS